MAMVHLKNSKGDVKKLKIGFSWTTFFFSVWVPLFRGQLGEVLKWFLLNPFTLGIWGIIQWFDANEKTIKYNLKKGYTPLREEDHNLLVKHKIVKRFKKLK